MEETQKLAEHFIPLRDDEIPERFRTLCAQYRGLATEFGVPEDVMICYRVRAGFNFMDHAPDLKECQGHFQSAFWSFRDFRIPIESTNDCWVFWITRPATEMSGRPSEPLQLVRTMRTRLGLPKEEGATVLGVASLISGLILTHRESKGHRLLECHWLKTSVHPEIWEDSNEGSFCCVFWTLDEDSGFYFGLFTVRK